TIENSISTNEEALEKLQEELCKEEIYSNPVESGRVNKEIKVLEEIIEKLYEEWEEIAN
ncbi:MAG: ABC transporter C-terminal domain-containing protein, partial [Bacilli bacterium]|nr:ABC transporter C-terminal domain-containing protein [Bacilli bacterium]